MADRALVELVAQWLPELGGRTTDAPWVADEVTEYLKALPGPIRVGVAALGRVLSALPIAASGRLSALPGSAEYVRLVRSLTTVVYLGSQEGSG
jgi:hypothetical protein